jgi:hypothetical protein
MDWVRIARYRDRWKTCKESNNMSASTKGGILNGYETIPPPLFGTKVRMSFLCRYSRGCFFEGAGLINKRSFICRGRLF